MDFTWKNGLTIKNDKIVRVKRMNDILEIVDLKTESNGFNKIKKLNKREYMLLDTGEVKNYVLSENRGQNIACLKESFRKIRDLINNNFVGADNEIHLVTTYAENMTDMKRLYNDNFLFWKNWKYRFGEHFEYLNIVEPQGRGAWHNHILIKDTKNHKLFIPHKEIKKVWVHGNIHIKTLKGVDNIGAYLSAYLADVELVENENGTVKLPDEILKAMREDGAKFEVKEVVVEGITKKFIKGGRCRLYPPGMNLYRKSKGIVHPEVEKMTYETAKRIVGSAQPNYSKTLEIASDDKMLNVITYENYNMKRLKNKGDENDK
jgi:hypothetical protein